MADMRKLAAEGQFAEARAINQRLMPLAINKSFVEPNPIPVKWACKGIVLWRPTRCACHDAYHGPIWS